SRSFSRPRPSATQSASAASRRCWSRAPAGPTGLFARAAPGGTRPSTSPGRRTRASSCRWRSAPPPRRRSAVPSSSQPPPEPAVVGLFGPTASGKSPVAEAIARKIPAELVSDDSAQLYRGAPILTNQSPAALVAVWELDHEASVAEYQVLAHAAIDAALASRPTP